MKTIKNVISSVARNLLSHEKCLNFKISPFGRNDKKRGFRSGTKQEELHCHELKREKRV